MKHLCSKCSLIWFVNNTNIYYLFQCKPELKVPGLYVVDSIVRQSRHQFGIDKDVFGPRFLKNFTDTFQNLYHCSEDDKVLYACSLVFFWYLQEIRIRNNSSVGFFFSLSEQNCPCAEPVAKEWRVWHGNHSASDGYGKWSYCPCHCPCTGR